MRVIKVLIVLLFIFTLSGCYMKEINGQRYSTPTEEELVRNQIWETYYDHEEVYLDKNLYGFDDIDWINVLSQNQSFRNLLDEMGDYAFLITVFENTQQYHDLGYYRIQIHYDDQVNGYGTGFEVPILDYSETYVNRSEVEVTIHVDGKEVRVVTETDGRVVVTYNQEDTTFVLKEINSSVLHEFEFGFLEIITVPLGYEILLNGEIYFVYDNDIFE